MEEEGTEKKRFEIPKPVSEGDVVEVTIEAQGGQGDGIAKVDGFVVFVKGAAKGESCKVKIVPKVFPSEDSWVISEIYETIAGKVIKTVMPIKTIIKIINDISVK